MNKKIISISALVVVFAVGFLYINQNYLIAHGKDGCTNKSACTEKAATETSSIKAAGEWASYEFTTDKACCEEMKSDLKSELMGVAGVKEVNFGTSCSVSKMTNVTIMYSAGETNSENIASFVKDKSYDCTGKSCNKDGVKSGSKKEGCDGKKECTPNKEKKSSDTKKL